MPDRGGGQMSDWIRGRIFGFEIQHIIPSEVMSSTTAAAVKARQFLASVGFDVESRGNKIALLISTATRNALLAAPQAVRDAFTNAGFGFNVHDSQSPGG